ncbi:MAG: tetratricopeptide repeat protein [Flavobacterium sp.]|uniref:tetratricopeptide repeat protein n=1 Tax=Flavobacterium sp. TaxID=239 RepID=UPI001220F751|nr:tetratricopeptide repeat protein [Flavobacterium sp.]RZJ68314.1 MAG: tetratricopeptide repeat protein [Flavobacterium sp.]
MTILKSAFFFALIAATSVASAQNGYWDKDRATTREIIVPAGDRIVVKTENFPLGTTELVYRITVLDENQQMANSLVSLLKSIPDPSGISQGSAGAVFLLSKISGDDKCNYAVFTDKQKSEAYRKSGKPEGACIYTNIAVNKEAKVITGRSLCLNSPNLYFGFESENWIMKQKIVVEVVPWVDKKASMGWTNENKKSILELCGTSGLAQLMTDSQSLCSCVLDQFTFKYSYAEYEKLLIEEKTKAFRDFGDNCLDSKTANKGLLQAVRTQAQQHYASGRYEKAIDLLNSAIIVYGNANARDYYNQGMNYLMSKQISKAKQSFELGEKLDDSDLSIKLGKAHALLLGDDFSRARDIYRKYKGENVDTKTSWTDRVKKDITDLKKAGIDSKDFDKVLKMLED